MIYDLKNNHISLLPKNFFTSFEATDGSIYTKEEEEEEKEEKEEEEEEEEEEKEEKDEEEEEEKVQGT